MKKWIVRIVVGLVLLVLVLAGGLYGASKYSRWQAQKARDARAAAIAAYYPTKARVFLYSLEHREAAKEEGTFHGYPIRGSVEITAWDEKAALLLSLAKGVEGGYYFSQCFDPRHGLRIESEDGQQIDLVICFSCSQVQPYNFNDNQKFCTLPFPLGVYNSILERHGLPVHNPKPRE